MVNLQSLLRLIAVIAAPALGVGFATGRGFGGWAFGVFFALVALLIGMVVVETPFWIANRLERRRTTRASSDELRASLDDDFRHYGHLKILRELQRRGESIEFEMPRLLRFLISPSPVNRVVGRAALREFFPAVSDKLADYNPYAADAPSSPIVAQLLREASPSS